MEQEKIWIEATLKRVANALKSARCPAQALAIEDLIRRLHRHFTVVVLGCFNSGKSSLINALVQSKICKTNLLPETAHLAFLMHGDSPLHRIILLNGETLTFHPDDPNDRLQWENALVTHQNQIGWIEHLFPHPLLEKITLMDAPGLNSIFPLHTAIAQASLRSADLILWVFDPLYAATQIDVQYLEHINAYKAKTVGVINKMDLVSEKERSSLTDFVQKHFGDAFTTLYLVSSLPPFDEKTARLSGREKLTKDFLTLAENFSTPQRLEALQPTMLKELEAARYYVEGDLKRISEQLLLIEEASQTLWVRKTQFEAELVSQLHDLLQERVTKLLERFKTFSNRMISWRYALYSEASLHQFFDDQVISTAFIGATIQTYDRIVLKYLQSIDAQAPFIHDRSELIAEVASYEEQHFIEPFKVAMTSLITRWLTTTIFVALMGIQEVLVLLIGGIHRISLIIYTTPLWIVLWIVLNELSKEKKHTIETGLSNLKQVKQAILTRLSQNLTLELESFFKQEETRQINRIIGISMCRDEIEIYKNRLTQALSVLNQTIKGLM